MVAGNLISDNDEADSPAQADGGFGTGVGIGGGIDNRIVRNRITGNPRAGLLLANTEDLAAVGNRVEANVFADNGVDVANVSASRAPASGGCLRSTATTLPRALAGQLARGCASDADVRLVAVDGARLPPAAVPDGANFLRVAPPRNQPNLPAGEVDSQRLSDTVTMPDLADVRLPDATLLADRSGTR